MPLIRKQQSNTGMHVNIFYHSHDQQTNKQCIFQAKFSNPYSFNRSSYIIMASNTSQRSARALLSTPKTFPFWPFETVSWQWEISVGKGRPSSSLFRRPAPDSSLRPGRERRGRSSRQRLSRRRRTSLEWDWRIQDAHFLTFGNCTKQGDYCILQKSCVKWNTVQCFWRLREWMPTKKRRKKKRQRKSETYQAQEGCPICRVHRREW